MYPLMLVLFSMSLQFVTINPPSYAAAVLESLADLGTLSPPAAKFLFSKLKSKIKRKYSKHTHIYAYIY